MARNLKESITRIRNRLYGEVIIPVIEKRTIINRQQIHYLFYRKKSNILIVVFQAVPAKEGVFRYNYVSALRGVRANKLYIQDDFAPFGTYYLGNQCDTTDIESAVKELIKRSIEECGAKKVIFAGSSKGGYAALNFGLEHKNSVIISGAPQYYLGDYISRIRKLRRTAAKVILREPISGENLKALDFRLKNKITEDPYADTQKVYLHCSVNENTYDLYVKDLLSDLKRKGIHTEFDAGEYPTHEEIKYYFPGYLKKCVRGEIKNE